MAQDIVTVDLGFVNAYLVKDRARLRPRGYRHGLAVGQAVGRPGLGGLRAGSAQARRADACRHGPRRAMRDASSPNGRSPSRSMPRTPPPSRRARRPSGAGRGPVAKAMMGIIGLFHGKGEGAERKPPLKPDLILEDGQSLAAWGLDARVIHLPGHTPGSIAFLTAEGDLVAGDVFANRRRPRPLALRRKLRSLSRVPAQGQVHRLVDPEGLSGSRKELPRLGHLGHRGIRRSHTSSSGRQGRGPRPRPRRRARRRAPDSPW